MKISATPQLRPEPPVTKNPRETTAAAPDFQAILKQTVEGLGDSQPADAVSRPFGLPPVRPLIMPAADTALPLTDRLDRLVDQLEHYRQKLADPQASLRSIAPLVNDIAAAAQKLAPELNPADRPDPLKDILKHALVTASVEITRFNRGEYS
ncbi:MAG: hypothetical protein WAM73_07130 [Desulfobacterales bacterium]